jgi:hypothetical protein
MRKLTDEEIFERERHNALLSACYKRGMAQGFIIGCMAWTIIFAVLKLLQL